jgi:hypothetical protein
VLKNILDIKKMDIVMIYVLMDILIIIMVFNVHLVILYVKLVMEILI